MRGRLCTVMNAVLDNQSHIKLWEGDVGCCTHLPRSILGKRPSQEYLSAEQIAIAALVHARSQKMRREETPRQP